MERPKIWHWTLPLLWILPLLLGITGCRICNNSHPIAETVIHASDNLASRATFFKWNIRNKCDSSDCLTRSSRALQLASHSTFELDSMMARYPAPSIDMLEGRWHGINKGVGAASIGLTQDIKVFRVQGPCPKGHNVAVHQVAIDELDCRGFEPKISPLTCCEKTMGNFVVVAPCSSCQPLKLDYTKAENSLADPSRWLVDELVMIDHDMLLGKAYAKVGQSLMPVAFFVLVRANASSCDDFSPAVSESSSTADEL